MDGIDVAMIETDGYGYIKPIGFLSESHDPEFREKLRACLNRTDRDSDDIMAIEREFTLRHIPIINNLIQNLNLTKQDIDLIGIHGQTTHHDPDQNITIQLCDGSLLAQETGINTVYDFRQADVKSGGQGAPFLPVYHRALALNAEIDLPIAIINIGGVGNITWIDHDQMVAFDTGPGNAMIDDWVHKHTGDPYDKDGEIAGKGIADQDILDEFLNSSYFSKKYPKSLDRNDFRKSDVRKLSLENGARTLLEMTVQSIAIGIFQCPTSPNALYVTGGGRHNKTIMQRLNEITKLPVHSTDILGWNGDSMEAEGFGYMAVRRILNEPISYPSTTGCPAPTIGGMIATADKKTAAA